MMYFGKISPLVSQHAPTDFTQDNIPVSTQVSTITVIKIGASDADKCIAVHVSRVCRNFSYMQLESKYE